GFPYFYYPLAQAPSEEVSVLIRSGRPASEMVALLRRKVAAIDPGLAVFNAGPMKEVIGRSLDNRRAMMLLLGSFAGIALLLSAVGIYGVLAYDVSQRTREIGIRAAMGATKGQVIALIVRQGMWKTVAGTVMGLAAAYGLSRFMVSLLYGVRPTDPAV